MLDREIGPGFAGHGYGIVDMNLTVVQGCHQGDGLEGRTRLHTLHSVIHHLVVLSVLASIQVADGFDLTAVRLHQYAAAPVGAGDLQARAQGFLADIEEVGIQGRDQVTAVYGLLHRDILHMTGYALTRADSLGAVQVLLKGLLQTCVTYSLLAVYTADRSASQTAVGASALVQFLKMETALIVASAHEGKLLDLAFLHIVDTRAADLEVAFLGRFAAKSPEHRLTILQRRAVAQDAAQALRDGVDIVVEEGITAQVQGLHARIHIYIVLRQAGRQEVTVGVEDLTPRRGYDLIGLDLLLGDLEPFVLLHMLRDEDLHQHQHEQGRYPQEDDSETQDGMFHVLTHGSTRWQ